MIASNVNLRTLIATCLLHTCFLGCAQDDIHVEEPVAPVSSQNASKVNPSPKASSETEGQQDSSQKLVISGEIELIAQHVRKTAEELKGEIRRLGGKVVEDRVHASADRSFTSQRLVARVPPSHVEALASFATEWGDVTSQRIGSSDVSREYFDRDMALKNHRLTLERLQALLKRPDIRMQEILDIEKELTRVRGEIERLEGAKRFQDDQMAFATVVISIEDARQSQEHAREVSSRGFQLGPRISLFKIGDGAKFRRASGLTVGWGKAFNFEFDRIETHPDAAQKAVSASIGSAMFSRTLANRRRSAGSTSWLHPWIGWRLGYIHDLRPGALAALDLGCELVRHKSIVWDLSGRFGATISNESGGSLTGLTTSLTIPF